MRQRRASVIATLCSPRPATAHAEGAWVLWKHSYEVWVDTNKDNHRRDVAWKKVKATTAKSDCDDRRVREARAAGLVVAGCATTDTFWAKPELTPATKADMSRYGQDAHDCVAGVAADTRAR